MMQMQVLQTKETTFDIFTLTLFLVSMVLSVGSVLAVTPKFELCDSVDASIGGIIKIWSDWDEEPKSLDADNPTNLCEKKMLFEHFT